MKVIGILASTFFRMPYILFTGPEWPILRPLILKFLFTEFCRKWSNSPLSDFWTSSLFIFLLILTYFRFIFESLCSSPKVPKAIFSLDSFDNYPNLASFSWFLVILLKLYFRCLEPESQIPKQSPNHLVIKDCSKGKLLGTISKDHFFCFAWFYFLKVT